MELPFNLGLNGIDAFFLVFVRMTGLFVFAPIFGRRNMPTYFKIGFSFMLALILVNTIKLPVTEYYNNFFGYAVLIFKEFIVGAALGYVSYLAFTGIYLAGQIIDTQVGFGVVNVMDPASNIQVSISSNFYFILAMTIFLLANGQHALIKALFDSYGHIPLGGAVFDTDLMNDIIRSFANIFIIGFRISAPIIAAVLVTDVALGVISRAVPQVNVFVVGMPLKIILGLLVMILTMPLFISFVDMMINGMDSEMANFIRHMGRGS